MKPGVRAPKARRPRVGRPPNHPKPRKGRWRATLQSPGTYPVWHLSSVVGVDADQDTRRPQGKALAPPLCLLRDSL